MKLNPRQAPVYGECVLTVQLNEDECAEDEDDVEFYLLFSGSTQRHLTSTLRVSHVTLQAVCPAHDRGEMVRVTLCQARPGGPVDPVSEEHFQFVHDLALDMAKFLISAAAHKDGLEGALLLDDSSISSQECERLDEALTLALKHLPLPPGWNVMGTEKNIHAYTDLGPHETLLHFAARRGLRQVALFLLQQPGGRDALQLLNKHGHTPARVAQKRGHAHLQNLLSELEKSPRLETKPCRRRYPEGRAFLHHPQLNTYTLTVRGELDGDPPDLEREVEELRRYVRSQQDTHCDSVPLILSCAAVSDSQPHDAAPSEGPSPEEPPVCEQQEVGNGIKNSTQDLALSDLSSIVGDFPSLCPNGSADLENSDRVSPTDFVGVEVSEEPTAECVCEAKQEDAVAATTVSCGVQRQQEEVDKELSRTRGEQQVQSISEDKAYDKIQSGNTQEGSMGQTQGLLPKEASGKAENNGRSRDLPSERSSLQDLPGLSTDNSPSASDERFTLARSASDLNEFDEKISSSREEAEQLCEPDDLIGSSGKTKPENELDEAEQSDPISLRPNMAPGPIHEVHLEPKVVKETTFNAPAEPPSCVSAASSNSSTDVPPSSELEPCNLSGSEPAAQMGGAVDTDGTLELNSDAQETPSGLEHVIQATMVSEMCGDEEPPPQTPESSDPYSEDDDSGTREQVESTEPETLQIDGMDQDSKADLYPVPHESVSESDQDLNPERKSEDIQEGEIGVESNIVNESEICEMANLLSHMHLTMPCGCHADDTVESSLDHKGVTDNNTVEKLPESRKLEKPENSNCTATSSCSSKMFESLEQTSPFSISQSAPAQDEEELCGQSETTEMKSLPCDSASTPETEGNIEEISRESINPKPDQLAGTSSEQPTSDADASEGNALTGTQETSAGKSDEEHQAAEISRVHEDAFQNSESLGLRDLGNAEAQSLQLSETTKPQCGPIFEPGPQTSSLDLPSGIPSVPPVPLVRNDSALLDTPASIQNTSADSDLAPQAGPTSDLLSVSTQPANPSCPVDLDSGTTWNRDTKEVDSGTTQDSSLPLETGGVCGTVDEEESRMEPGCMERPSEEPLGDDSADGLELMLVQVDQSVIHRDSEILYSLESDEQKDQSSTENTCADVPDGSVCRSVSASSLHESLSDGDSLLGPDDSVFKQSVSEDAMTLTSGISVSGSISTDDSSIVQMTVEPEEEEKKDRLTEVLQRSTILRSNSRSHSPSRRHSWGPSKNKTEEADLVQRSPGENEEGERAPCHRRSMSWCPSDVPRPHLSEMNTRSYSLDGLADDVEEEQSSCVQPSTHSSTVERTDRGSLASLTEEEHDPNTGDNCSLDSQKSGPDVCGVFLPPHTLTKSVSMSAISPKDLDANGRFRPKRRISFSFSVSPLLPKSKPHFAFGSSSSDDEEAANLGSLTSAAGSLEYSICEEDLAPLRTDIEVKGTKVSRTFSYLKSKMSKKSKEKDRDRCKDGKEKEKRSSSGHQFSSAPVLPTTTCLLCGRSFITKDAFTCTNCGANVHKGCRDGLPPCAKVKMKVQTVPDSASMSGVSARAKSVRERPWSTILLPEDQASPLLPPPRRNASIVPFNSNPLSKSLSISNIAGHNDEVSLKLQKVLSQSTDSLNKITKGNESIESLTDEGAELMDGNLMVEFELEVKELEADSWSFTVDKKYLKQLKKDVIKRQDVIYELIQTELHHLRTLHIMADVYSKGLQKEMQLEVLVLEKMFPVLDDLLTLHTDFLTHLLERKREAREEENENRGGFVIRRIGDVLLNQVTGSNAERMKKVYGKFCSRHNEAVNVYKEIHARDKRFQAFIKKKMSSAVVRRLSIPECVLLVTQRITKYPVLLQRILQHTREPEVEQADVAEALKQMKEVITGVDSKVNEYEKKRRLKEVYSRTDSKSIMRMKSGQMFAREDLIRGRKLLHDGPLQLKNAAGRLKDVQALLLSDVFVFLQEKDQKFVFASLDQRSTVISLRNLIVREVANEERGLFFITAGIENPEMVEVHATSKEERNTWMHLIQNTSRSTEKDEDEGIPSESEEDKRLQESKAKEMRDQLQKKDEQIVALLEEKVLLFRDLCDCTIQDDDTLRSRMMFRSSTDDITKGEPIIRDAFKEVDSLQELVSSVFGQQGAAGQDGSIAGSVSLPRRSETFGGFDSHQISKNGERDEADELRRTESDSVLKKGVTANLLLMHKRNSEQILHSVSHLHDLLSTLQGVVIQQDTFIEEQRLAQSSSIRHPSISSSSSTVSSCSSFSSRPSSLMEQEKQRQEEKQKEEEKRRKEEEERKQREDEEERRRREEELVRREQQVQAEEEENERRKEALQREEQELNNMKEEYQRELLQLRDDQRRLEREREQLHLHEHTQVTDSERRQRTYSTTSEESLKLQNLVEGTEVFSRADSKRKAKTLNPFTSTSGHKGGANEPHSQIPSCLLQLTKPKEKKEKKKKKGKGGAQNQSAESQSSVVSEASSAGDVYFC